MAEGIFSFTASEILGQSTDVLPLGGCVSFDVEVNSINGKLARH